MIKIGTFTKSKKDVYIDLDNNNKFLKVRLYMDDKGKMKLLHNKVLAKKLLEDHVILSGEMNKYFFTKICLFDHCEKREMPSKLWKQIEVFKNGDK